MRFGEVLIRITLPQGVIPTQLFALAAKFESHNFKNIFVLNFNHHIK